jgi:hypothetical protein
MPTGCLETFLGVLPVGERPLQEAQTEGLSMSLAGVTYQGSGRVL